MSDKRYSIALEYCGYVKRRWVVRFCGEWIGTGKNRADADAIVRQHAAARLPNRPFDKPLTYNELWKRNINTDPRKDA